MVVMIPPPNYIQNTSIKSRNIDEGVTRPVDTAVGLKHFIFEDKAPTTK